MLAYLHRLSAFFFYLLGLSFFAAYILLRNKIGDVWPAWWMQVADLPLALCAVLYGGLSFYRSMSTPERPARVLGLITALVMIGIFAFVVYLNFVKVLW